VKKTTIKNIIQINKLAGKLESEQNKLPHFCHIYATNYKFVVFFVKTGCYCGKFDYYACP